MDDSEEDEEVASLGSPWSNQHIIDAMRRFQELNGLSVTGEFDENSLEEMGRPRCGMKDFDSADSLTDGELEIGGVHSKWDKNHLTYRLHNRPSQYSGSSNSKFDEAVRQAFDLWSKVVPLTFTEVDDEDASVDIDIMFANKNHGDGEQLSSTGHANQIN